MSTGTRYPDQDFQNNPNTTPSSNPNTTGNMHTLMPNTSDQVHHEVQAPPIGRNTSSGSDEDAFDDDEDDDEDDDVEEDYNDLADALSWDSTKHSASSSEGSSVPSQHHGGPGSFHRSGDKATSAPVSSTLSATSGVVASRKEKLTFQELSKYFEMPFFKVCKRVNVCETILKKLCRKLGIPRWPHRKIRSIDRRLQALEDTRQSYLRAKKSCETLDKEIKSLKTEREKIVTVPQLNVPDKKIHRPQRFVFSYWKDGSFTHDQQPLSLSSNASAIGPVPSSAPSSAPLPTSTPVPPPSSSLPFPKQELLLRPPSSGSSSPSPSPSPVPQHDLGKYQQQQQQQHQQQQQQQQQQQEQYAQEQHTQYQKQLSAEHQRMISNSVLLSSYCPSHLTAPKSQDTPFPHPAYSLPPPSQTMAGVHSGQQQYPAQMYSGQQGHASFPQGHPPSRLPLPPSFDSPDHFHRPGHFQPHPHHQAYSHGGPYSAQELGEMKGEYQSSLPSLSQSAFRPLAPSFPSAESAYAPSHSYSHHANSQAPMYQHQQDNQYQHQQLHQQQHQFPQSSHVSPASRSSSFGPGRFEGDYQTPSTLSTNAASSQSSRDFLESSLSSSSRSHNAPVPILPPLFAPQSSLPSSSSSVMSSAVSSGTSHAGSNLPEPFKLPNIRPENPLGPGSFGFGQNDKFYGLSNTGSSTFSPSPPFSSNPSSVASSTSTSTSASTSFTSSPPPVTSLPPPAVTFDGLPALSSYSRHPVTGTGNGNGNGNGSHQQHTSNFGNFPFVSSGSSNPYPQHHQYS